MCSEGKEYSDSGSGLLSTIGTLVLGAIILIWRPLHDGCNCWESFRTFRVWECDIALTTMVTSLRANLKPRGRDIYELKWMVIILAAVKILGASCDVTLDSAKMVSEEFQMVVFTVQGISLGASTVIAMRTLETGKVWETTFKGDYDVDYKRALKERTRSDVLKEGKLCIVDVLNREYIDQPGLFTGITKCGDGEILDCVIDIIKFRVTEFDWEMTLTGTRKKITSPADGVQHFIVIVMEYLILFMGYQTTQGQQEEHYRDYHFVKRKTILHVVLNNQFWLKGRTQEVLLVLMMQIMIKKLPRQGSELSTYFMGSIVELLSVELVPFSTALKFHSRTTENGAKGSNFEDHLDLGKLGIVPLLFATDQKLESFDNECSQTVVDACAKDVYPICIVLTSLMLLSSLENAHHHHEYIRRKFILMKTDYDQFFKESTSATEEVFFWKVLQLIKDIQEVIKAKGNGQKLAWLIAWKRIGATTICDRFWPGLQSELKLQYTQVIMVQQYPMGKDSWKFEETEKLMHPRICTRGFFFWWSVLIQGFLQEKLVNGIVNSPPLLKSIEQLQNDLFRHEWIPFEHVSMDAMPLQELKLQLPKSWDKMVTTFKGGTLLGLVRFHHFATVKLEDKLEVKEEELS